MLSISSSAITVLAAVDSPAVGYVCGIRTGDDSGKGGRLACWGGESLP
jgi:hypothetical protein